MPKTKIEWLIARNVRTIRKAKKKTQRDIASCLNVSAGYIGQIETEDSASMYSFDNLNELAKYLGCSMRDFMPENPL
ncbi:helix-turn-helix domain-containing protein [Parapedobacter indicus]|uniref:Helix-turn-helix n=1 Tax=Parapedobacter indicus TaxID=1477437 RepID=A0A1I3UIF7_9SPHI|nr:helix-turn-helix protein [Parapedobacter indicus]SFJ82483.1 Helix-turn-helix [Parapedobacter indicus]